MNELQKRSGSKGLFYLGLGGGLLISLIFFQLQLLTGDQTQMLYKGLPWGL